MLMGETNKIVKTIGSSFIPARGGHNMLCLSTNVTFDCGEHDHLVPCTQLEGSTQKSWHQDVRTTFLRSKNQDQKDL